MSTLTESIEIEEAAGQVVIAGFAGLTFPPELTLRVMRRALGGIIVFKRNVGGIADVAALVASAVAQSPADTPLLVSVDQEGGRVARLGPPVLRLPPARAMARWPDDSLRDIAEALGVQLRALGFTCDFAPVLDVDTNPDNPVIGDRAFGDNVEAVVRKATAFAAGLGRAGIIACGKHFPGHGDTLLDSHLTLPRVSHPRSRLEAVELAPFAQTHAALPMLMTAHVVFDALDGAAPATLSRHVVTDVLRGQLGYRGVIVSDDLEMKAVAGSMPIGDAAVAAIGAGCDALLVCSGSDAIEEVCASLARAATGDLEFRARLGDAAGRFLALRRRHRPTPIVDADALGRALEVPDRVTSLLARAAPVP